MTHATLRTCTNDFAVVCTAFWDIRMHPDNLRTFIDKQFANRLAVCELFFVVSSISAMAMGDDGEDDDEK